MFLNIIRFYLFLYKILIDFNYYYHFIFLQQDFYRSAHVCHLVTLKQGNILTLSSVYVTLSTDDDENYYMRR